MSFVLRRAFRPIASCRIRPSLSLPAASYAARFLSTQTTIEQDENAEIAQEVKSELGWELDGEMSMSEIEDSIDQEFMDDDAPSSGHLMLREHRRNLLYLRLIEHDMPKLVAYRKTFTPPTAATPIVVRSLDYAGENHPATAKRVIVVQIDHLPLDSDAAAHKIKLLAGTRWTPGPPINSGVSSLTLWGHGFITISCEHFPEPAMNLKWASDVLDKLIAEANDSKSSFGKLPLDLRHVRMKNRKAKKGYHTRNRDVGPSAEDFPVEWLH